MSRVMDGTEIRSAPSRAGLALTPVERRVIALTAAGRSLSEIQVTLGLSFPGVKRQRAHILEKLGAVNAPNAVAIWLGREAMRRVS